jgi:hypothetical protein
MTFVGQYIYMVNLYPPDAILKMTNFSEYRGDDPNAEGLAQIIPFRGLTGGI